MGERGRCCPTMRSVAIGIGELGLFQFKDIKRCAGKWHASFMFSREQTVKAGVLASKRSPVALTLIWMTLSGHGKVKLGELEAELIEMNANSENLQHAYNELLEYKLVLQKAGDLFSSILRTYGAAD